jgi:hypothetical protein
MNTEHFTRIFLQFFVLTALSLLKPSTSLTDALSRSDKHLQSTSVLPLLLAHCFTHMLPHLSPQDSVVEHSAAASPLSLTHEHKTESSHAVRCLLYRFYCMPGNFYTTMDKPSLCTVTHLETSGLDYSIFSRTGRFSCHDVTGLTEHCNSRGYGVILQYATNY